MALLNVGFIGTGVMGAPMAGHLLDAGYRMQVYTRTAAKAATLIERGARLRSSPGELASECDVIITMVGYPADVRAIYLGPDGLVARARTGTLLIDMTTSSPKLAREIAAAATARGCAALDAPVSGGDVGAREARLSIMVGGTPEAFERARPLFERMGKTIQLQGPAGAGQVTKLCNQIALAGAMLGGCEAMTFARRCGLDPMRVLDSIGAGAAGSWVLLNLMPRALRGDWSPGFFVKHYIKDLGIALESASELGLHLPAIATANELYRRLADAGHSEDGTQALLRLYEAGL